MKWFYKVQYPADLPDYLINYIADVCYDNKMNYPRIGLINDNAPNAFTYGRTKNDVRIILTRGIFNLLDEEEVKAVVGHELGHAVHYDMALMTAVQIVPMILYAIADLCFHSDSGKNSETKTSGKSSGNYIAIIGLLSLIFYYITQYIILWLSRTREYYADHFSCESTKNPNRLATALVKVCYGLSVSMANENKHSVSSPTSLGIADRKSSISLAVSSSEKGHPSIQHIRDAMKWDLWNPWAFWYELSSTHPLIAKRLLAISDQCSEYDQIPEITFDEEPVHYNGSFLFEMFLLVFPWIFFISAIVCAVLNLNLIIISACMLLMSSSMLFRHWYTHKNNGYPVKSVQELLSEVSVSGVRSVPCKLKGKIIGRGNPGCIFSENFVLQDETGIIFLNYRQPLRILEKLFALFKLQNYINQTAVIHGWYRRAPVPYIELLDFEVCGKKRKCRSVFWGYLWRGILTTISLLFLIISLTSII